MDSVRGALAGDVEVAVPGGELGAVTMVVPDMPRFEPGRVYLLLLSRRDDGRYSVVEQALGAFDVLQDADGTRWATRLSFSEKKASPVAVLGADGVMRAGLEPMRRLDTFLAAIRDVAGSPRRRAGLSTWARRAARRTRCARRAA